MQNLTKKQKEVFDFISQYIRDNGISPTIEEIKRGLKLQASSTVHEHVDTLVRKKYLARVTKSARSLVVKKELRQIIKIPIIGKLIAYTPNNKKFGNDTYFALKVKGNNMSKEGIVDGDIVIIKN